MKKTVVLTSIAVLFVCIAASAQVNTDSLAIIAKISEYQLKLGKLQNMVNEKTNNKQNDSLHAQQSATANATAANTLNANPQDKADARQADRTAGQAKGDARKARNASGKLDDLNKEIADYQTKIAKEQLKLNQFTHSGYAPAGATTQPLPDSSQHP